MLKNKRKRLSFLLSGILICSIATTSAVCNASPRYMPQVTQQMTQPAFWGQAVSDPNGILADANTIALINSRTLHEDACNMTDLKAAPSVFDGDKLKTNITEAAAKELEKFANGSYYDVSGAAITSDFTNQVLANISGMEGGASRGIAYGICTTHADIRTYPSPQIVTETQGDSDCDEWQLASLRVGEPVLIKTVSADRRYYYVTSDCVSGWVYAGCIALCANKNEWLYAWDIPSSQALVVTTNKFRLEKSNTNPDVSETLLTMGTVLRRASDQQAAGQIINRLSYNTYTALLPVRKADGYYAQKLVLIPENRGITEGYLPLTVNNILSTAFSFLGDTYGWGAGLSSEDCSSYMRDVYHCFGLNLPRNTTWQAAMPTAKVKWEKDVPVESKKEVLNTLLPGAILIFSGHEMMYLGHIGDTYYVVSAVGSIRDFQSDNKLRVRGVVINTLDVKRMSGHTWLEDIHTAVIPYQL